MVKRFARIYPLYFVILLIVALSGTEVSVINLTLTQAYFPSALFSGLPTAWTLTVEESFYLIAPLVFFLCVRSRYPYLTLIAIVIAMFIIGHIQIVRGVWTLHFMSIYTIFGRLVDFATGIGFALLYRYLKPRRNLSALVILSGVTVLLLQMAFAIKFSRTEIFVGLPYMWMLSLTSGVLIFTLASDTSFVARAMSWQPFVYAGRVSYAVYLIHLMPPIQAFYSRHLLPLGPVATVLLYLLTTVLSICAYELIEKPMRGWIVGLFSRRSIAVEAVG